MMVSRGVDRVAHAGFEAFAVAERPSLLRAAALMMSSRADAEDAVQDALAAVSVRWSDLNNPASYARTCLLNACKMQLRRRDLERRRQPAPSQVDAQPSSLVELEGALSRLSTDERAAIVMRYVLDLPDPDIATAIDCKPATVRSHLLRGLRKLRKELAND
jgi:RNA polymerase sigma factor (sigma-70 family)